MANNVYTDVAFYKMNDEAKKHLLTMYERIRTEQKSLLFADMLVSGEEDAPTYEEIDSDDWNNDNLGTKWCFIDDEYEAHNEEGFRTVSAWSYPNIGLYSFLWELGSIDPEMITEIKYREEFDFIGAVIYKGTEEIDAVQYDVDEMMEYADADDEEAFYDNVDETVDDMLSGFIYESLKSKNLLD
jgi:hypothetical protein